MPTHKYHKSKRCRFQFELLEPRQLFSVSNGTMPPLVEPMTDSADMSFDHHSEMLQDSNSDVSIVTQLDQSLTNQLYMPFVSAGPNASVNVLSALQLNADVFVNVESNLLLQWTQLSGPGVATFSDSTAANSTVQFDQAGTYVLKLAALNFGTEGSGFVTVSVNETLATDPIAPELFDTTYALPTGGTTHRPTNGTEFQAALDVAQPGDVIVLQAGTTYTGNFVMRDKGASTDWIYIVSSNLASLPVGERVGMDDAANMPKLVSGNYQLPAIRTDYGAHHYRLAGIELPTIAGHDVLAQIATGYGIPPGGTVWDFWLSPADTVEELPHHITFDRLLVYSNSDTYKLRHGIMLNGRYMAVIDSHIANVKDGADAQAVWIYNGDGPYKIVNNFLEATGENFMSGGTEPRIANSVPSDIEFRGNYLFKRLDWRVSPNFNLKNLFELKNAQRVLVSGNVMENNWADGQNGTAILFTVRNENGTAPWSVVQDINFESNVVKNVGIGFNITGEDDRNPSQQTKRIRIHNNVLENVTSDYTMGPAFIQLSTPNRPILNLTVTHNTFLSATDETGPINHIAFPSGRITVDGFVLKDNVMVHGTYPPVWTRATNTTISNNALIMLPSSPNYAWNKGNFNKQHPGWLMLDPGFAAARFVDYQGGDYRLAAGSPLKSAASDGSDMGANMDVLLQAVGQVAVGGLGAQDSLQASLADAWSITQFTIDPVSAPKSGHSSFVPQSTLEQPLEIDPVPHDSYFESRGEANAVDQDDDSALTQDAASTDRAAELEELYAFLARRLSKLV